MAQNKDDNKPTIIIKKGGHGGHHGGAWKIAYADFTTAMMCFFLCMWLINSASVTTRQAIASYFRKPTIFQEGSGQPLLLGGQGILDDAYVPPREKDPRKIKQPQEDQKTYGEVDRNKDKLYIEEGKVEPIRHRGPTEVTGLNSPQKTPEETRKEIKLRIIAEKTKQEIEKILNSAPAVSRVRGAIDAKVEPDGLKIEIMDTDTFSMFDSGSARIRPEAEPAFKQITEIIKRYPNSLEIFGHTDAQPFPTRTGGYTNWELSADRANSARRLMESQGFPVSRVESVTGRASSELRKPEDPLHPSNRRITLKLKFNTNTDLFRDESADKVYNDPLKEILKEEQARAEATAIAVNANAPEPTPETPAPTPPPATPTETPIPEPSTSSASQRVQLPNSPPNTTNPDYMPKDKIFDDNPVLGPRDIIAAP
jgi:chemotaxis protein MotB